MAPQQQFRPRTPPSEPPEVVDPRWILKALAAVVALGLVCSYATLCAFFFYGQWQFLLHPSHTVAQTPASQQIAFEDVRFADDLAGKPQVAGWWIPATPGAPTVLMLHSETGSMSDALPRAKSLHDADLNVLLFDYRGYGTSGGQHPTQSTMRDDAAHALQYLTDTRKLQASSILIYGEGLGASLATGLAARNQQISGVILLNADGDTASRVEADQRSRIVPVGLLFHERFPLADPLHTLRTPKLLISLSKGHAPEFAERAADPKMTVELPPEASGAQVTQAVRRFLDTYRSPSLPLAAQ